MTIPSDKELKTSPITGNITGAIGLGEMTIINYSCSWVSQNKDPELAQSLKCHSNNKV